ncbi:putrescine transport system ATP-binding protein [Duganella sp. CF517]|uniref:ABC transporter ATP-binding protein n=1 Tax=Duganella sp. CF517 TaxID=1881038 RepID=UPI0008D6A500|nr:polyamine ABC transporter ATP-binding protein [Duganella sp. CF517]SEO40173.1 putrescine transport system ATP-binding protein [Duganella sp. CF517]
MTIERAAEPFLLIRNLVKEFDGVRAVNDVSVAINKGEIFALLGSSGCGKSTLLRMLAGFETPTQGQITLAGKDIVSVPPYQRPINMMFQSYALFPHLSVWDNIAFGLRRDGLPKDEISARVEQMLNLVQLAAYGKRKPHQLSGGQQQRVALARSLAKRPQLLLLDEPLGALDKKLRERTQMELVGIIEEVGVTCVMVTHDQDEAMSMATRIAVMSEGRILQVGPPGEIYETPNCRFVADFIGSVNLFNGSVAVDEPDHVIIDTPEGRHYVTHGITGTMGMPVSVAVRPEKIALQTEAPTLEQRANAGEHGYNCVQGAITAMAYFGNETLYHVRLDSGMEIKVSRTNAARHDDAALKRDQRVYAWWDGADVVVLTS